LAILTICLILINILNIVFNALTYLPSVVNLLCVVAIVVHFYMLRRSLLNTTTEQSKFWYFIFLTMCLAIIWILNNGVDSSMPINFMFYLITGLLTLSGHYRTKFIRFFILITIICLIIDLFFPQYLVPYTDDMSKHLDLLTSFFMCVIITTIMVSSYKNVYDYEKKILSIQKKKLEKSQRELIQSNKIAEAATQSKSKFIMTMSHEIRTPLNGIIGTIDLLKTTPLDSNQRLLVDNLQASSHILYDLVADLLDISRIEANKIELHLSEFSLKSALEGIESVLQPMLKDRDLTLTIEMGRDKSLRIVTDEARFKQILLNLLSNAIKFTRKGNIKVNIATSMVDETTYLTCAVQDTGIGIREEDIPHLFEQFTQIEQHINLKNRGVGLGLTICDKLVTTLGGEITVQSVYGVGSTFTFRIPIKESISDPAPSVIKKEKKISNMNELKILIAEDNRINQLVLSKMLEELGYANECVDDGLEALEKLKQEFFDIVIMDIQMPIMNGLESTKQILAHYAEKGHISPIIIGCSAHAIESDRTGYLNAGMDEFIIKPISLNHLKETIEKVIRS